jgi:glycine/D-amino acid oxidase-like deaminating enzyme
VQRFDFIVTGTGLAGSSIAYELVKRGFKVLRVTSSVRPASMAAYGMLSPVHIRNAQLSWKAREIYPVAVSFYRELQTAIQQEFFRETEIFHILGSQEEAIYWRQQAETGMLADFCNGEVAHLSDSSLNAPLGGMKITGALYVDLPLLLHELHKWLDEHHSPLMICEAKDQVWSYDEKGVRMNDVVAGFAIQCEGVAATSRSLWKNIPFRPCKGEVLTLQFHEPVPQLVIHKKIFLIPQPDGTCKAGATYEWNDLSDVPTEEGVRKILYHVASITSSAFSVKEQVAGIRPAIADRRPVVGIHPIYPSVAILNGYGSRGLILNPYCCKILADHFLHQKPIPDELNVQRFNKRLLAAG